MPGITMPFNPGQIEFDGALPGVGGLQQLITQLASAGAPFLGNWQYNTSALAGQTPAPTNWYTGGILTRTGQAGISDTTPTGSALIAAVPGAVIGTTWPLLVCNLNSGTLTAVAGSGVTLGGTTTIVTVAARLFWFNVTAAPVAIIGLSYAAGVVTLTTNSPHGLAAGGSAIVANLANSAFNGTFTIATVPNAFQLTYALAAATAFATNAILPAPSAQSPALLNTTAAVTMQGCFAWPATMIA